MPVMAVPDRFRLIFLNDRKGVFRGHHLGKFRQTYIANDTKTLEIHFP
jgi:hypothetical protein